jgi:hypothetical protein
MRFAEAWECVPGRDRRAWLEYAWPQPRAFDAVRMTFLLGPDSWEGMPHSVRLRISADRRRWTTVSVQSSGLDPQSAAPRIETVTYPLDRLRTQYLRIGFPNGGVGGIVRVLETAVLATTRNEKGAIVHESPDMARAGLGVRVTAESSASPDKGPEHTTDGVAGFRKRPAAPVSLGVAVAPADAAVAYGDAKGGGQTFRLPSGWLEGSLKDVAWLDDGRVTYCFARPVELTMKRAGRRAATLGVRLGSGPFAMFVSLAGRQKGGGEPSTRLAWRVVDSTAVWMEDVAAGVGVVASLDAVRGPRLRTDDAVALCYWRDGALLRVSADPMGPPSRISLEMDGIEGVFVNGERTGSLGAKGVTFPVGRRSR